MFKAQILQITAKGIFLGYQKKVIIKLQHIQDSGIYAD